jgi:hypothetical protein
MDVWSRQDGTGAGLGEGSVRLSPDTVRPSLSSFGEDAPTNNSLPGTTVYIAAGHSTTPRAGSKAGRSGRKRRMIMAPRAKNRHLPALERVDSRAPARQNRPLVVVVVGGHAAVHGTEQREARSSSSIPHGVEDHNTAHVPGSGCASCHPR